MADPTPLLEHIGAETGVLNVLPPAPEPVQPLSVLPSLRLNPELSLQGQNMQPAKCCEYQPLHGWVDACSPVYDPTVTHKCTQTCWTNVSFWPFLVYALEEVRCASPTQDIAQQAIDTVNANTDWALTTELDRSPWSNSPSLRSTAIDITPTNAAGDYQPVSPTQGLMMLSAQYRNRQAGGYVLHAPVETMYAFNEQRLVTRSGQNWRTATGITVVTSPGLSGVAPFHGVDADGEAELKTGVIDTGTTDRFGETIYAPSAAMEAAPYEGVITIYATRSVPEYNLSPTLTYDQVFDLAQRGNFQAGRLIDERTNSSLAESVRQGALRFDPFCVYAVQVCFRSESVCAS